MSLLHLFWRMSQKTHLNFAATYVHHGHTADKKQNQFRNKAESLVKKTCAKYGVKFLATDSSLLPRGESEARLREFRYEILREKGYDCVVTAHHWDDLLETRLIRLIRGTGPQGLEGMREIQFGIWRPFLHVGKPELTRYAEKWKLKWLEDPSNKDEKKLRNWVRRKWLPELEKMRPGSSAALARSLELISKQDTVLVEIKAGALDRNLLTNFNDAKKQQVLAQFLREQNITNYSLNQINEVIKRLNTKRKRFAFVVAHLRWQVSDKYLKFDKD